MSAKYNRGMLETAARAWKISGIRGKSCDELVLELTKKGCQDITEVDYCKGHVVEGTTLKLCKTALKQRSQTKRAETKPKTEETMKYDPEAELKKLMSQELNKMAPPEVLSADDLTTQPEEIKTNTLIAYRVDNPSEMVQLDGALYKSMVINSRWEADASGKKKKVWFLAGLADYDYPPIFPCHSPMFNHIQSGNIKCCIVSQREHITHKIRRGHKAKAFEIFRQACMANGYLAITPDFKRTELRIYYGTPEMLCTLFGVTEEKLYSSLDKLHKWVKLIDSPSKMEVKDDRPLKVLYVEEPTNVLGKDQRDGAAYANFDVIIIDRHGKNMWNGFSKFLQTRSYIESGTLLKFNLCADKRRFRYEERRARKMYPEIGKQRFDLILNQHAVKFNNIGMQPGHIYEFTADQIIRIINARLKPGTSTLGRQLIAANNQKVMAEILKEKGIMEAAHRIKELAKGDPEAWLDLHRGYEKVDTNEFLKLALCIHREWGWRMPKLYNIHNRAMSFLESEWRKTIASTLVNTRSAYTYTDPRCDMAMEAWHDKTGEWVSFVTIDSQMEHNSRDEVCTVKYPLHSSPCICSHKVLREDIFNSDSDIIYGVEGGIGMSTLYMRSVHGLDEDGDKVAIFKTEQYVPVELNLTPAEPEVKGEKDEIKTLIQASQYIGAAAKVAAAETHGIGQKDLAITYALAWLHLHNYTLTPEISSLIGEFREGNIKGGIKGADGLKGINAPTIDTVASLEAGTLMEDTIKWMSEITGQNIEKMSDYGDLNKMNLAELVHALVTKNAKCKSNKHSEKFLFRMLELLPAYVAHPGDKSQVAWHDAFMELASGIKKEYLEFELNDHKIIQGMYVSAWNMIKASFTKFGPELGYSFDLEMTCGYAEWLRSFYAANRASILNDYRGINDRETGEILLVGDWDVERRARRFQRLNRVIRFLLHGLKPHQADLDSISYKEIPAGILSRSEWFGQKNKDTNMYLQCMVTYIGAIDINAKGKTGNSGELTRLFPAVPFVNAIQLYWEHCAAGKEVNPYLSVAKDRAVEFDAHWMDRAMKWLEKNPYGDEFVYPENDYEGFEEAEISESDDDDSVA